MFNKTKTMAKQGKGSNGNGYVPAVNLLSEGTEIQGEIKSNDDIRIDGTLKGVIHSKAKVVIGSTGKVEGEIYCASADVLGKIEGTVQVKEILYLKSSAQIDGDIETGKLVVESGATFNGKCSMGAKESMARKENRIDPAKEQQTNGRSREQAKAAV